MSEKQTQILRLRCASLRMTGFFKDDRVLLGLIAREMTGTNECQT
jgi:hypothetical protein